MIASFYCVIILLIIKYLELVNLDSDIELSAVHQFLIEKDIQGLVY